jgi:hypothetical protein
MNLKQSTRKSVITDDSGTSKKVTGAQLLSYIDGNHTHTLSEITDAGTAAASDSSDFEPAGTSAALAISLSNRNLIINGAMQVAQRGTSSTSAGYVSLDRWYVDQSGGSTTFSQETNTNPSETDGLQRYARLNVSTSSDFTSIRQPIEDVTSVQAGTVTLSFYAKGTAPTGGLYVWGTQNFGSGGSANVSIANVQITASLTSSWVRYTAQITIPSIDGKTIGVGSYLLLNIGQYSNTATTAYDLNITGVQLEVGDTATPFEHRSYGDELARCQRYYYRHTSLTYFDGNSGNSTVARGGAKYAVTMRAVPTIVVNSGSNLGGTNGSVYISHTNSNTTISSVQGITVDGFDTISKSSNLPSSSYVYACSFSADAEL